MQSSRLTNLIVRNFHRTNVRCQVNPLKQDENFKAPVQYPLLDTKFNQYRIAYRYRRSVELLRGYLVYRIFSINFLVNNQVQIANWGQKVFGRRLFKSALKLTAFGHFVGGETTEEIKPVICRLSDYGVRPILDYSVESDDGDAQSSTNVQDHNTEKFLECIDASRHVCGPNNLIAIKVTALIRPETLKKFNHVMKSIENRFQLPSIFSLFNEKSENFKELVPWANYLTDTEWIEVESLIQRLNKIGQKCSTQKISIMVDAEQSYFQSAINYMATELQRYFNRDQTPVIYGTYQCYLKETLTSLKHDLALSEKENYIFAAKLVRGAYMEQERRLAEEHGYDDPINPSFEATSKMYHSCFDETISNFVRREKGKVCVMIASHNEETIRYAIETMKTYQIERDSSLISFASLYGMSDYVAFALAHSGYKTFKYLPYGPIESLQPYLFRRAQENRSIFEKADKDRRLHLKAFQDRLLRLKA